MYAGCVGCHVADGDLKDTEDVQDTSIGGGVIHLGVCEVVGWSEYVSIWSFCRQRQSWVGYRDEIAGGMLSVVSLKRE